MTSPSFLFDRTVNIEVYQLPQLKPGVGWNEVLGNAIGCIGSVCRSKPGMTMDFVHEELLLGSNLWMVKDERMWRNPRRKRRFIYKSPAFVSWDDSKGDSMFFLLQQLSIWIFTHRFLSINTLVSRSSSLEGMNFLDDHSNLASVLNII